MNKLTRILILGGYGTFGGRLVQLLGDRADLTLLIAGRSLDKATRFCAGQKTMASLYPIALDREGDLVAQIRAVTPDLIVDASGPFQDYGSDAYRVVRAALELGIDYLDFADGSDFVAGIRQFDAAARQRGIFILSGVSSFPVLTAAVVRHLTRDLTTIDTIWGGIAPSPYAGVGPNVVRAIAGYAGQKTKLRRDGRDAVGYAMAESRQAVIAPPGRVPLRSLRFSLVDVPDLQVLPMLWPEVKSVWMGAAPVPVSLHRALNALAWLVRLGLVRSLTPLAGLMYRAINLLRWGEHRGGMIVAVTGRDAQGQAIELSWHLLAEADDGPLIPSMAIEGIIRRCLDGDRPAPGARAATHDLELADYEKLFGKRAIHAGMRRRLVHAVSGAGRGAVTESLYHRQLDAAWPQVPVVLREMHEIEGGKTVEGRAVVERGRGLLARLVAALFRFPEAGRDVPVRVSFVVEQGREIWRRRFAGRSFSSVQSQGTGTAEHLLVEQFGPVRVDLAIVAEEGRLRLVPRRLYLFGCPMPRAWTPIGDSYESVVDGRFNFHVEIAHPLTGLIVRYRGWLAPATE